jgi:iron complex outermembrane receptor protein
LSINHRFVARQNHLLPEQDFVLPPDAYHLTGLQTQYKWTTKSNEWLLTLRVDNLFNQVYRDYLNRLRYFADETGTNVSLGLLFQF